MTSHPGIVVTSLTWNLFHGRDDPPSGSARHADAKRSLLDEFATVLDGLPWDIALLQEAPPRWLAPLGRRCRAHGALALTSRNELPFLRAAIADRFPDLIKSNEGGSNMVLVRAPATIEAVERHTLARKPERRTLLLASLALPGVHRIAVANVHLSVPSTGQGEGELLAAAELAVRFAGDDPLILGGDLNLRPVQHAHAFAEAKRRFGLAAPTAPRAIDHLLVRGLEVVQAPHALEPEAREVKAPDGRLLRLSDHAPVAGVFGVR